MNKMRRVFLAVALCAALGVAHAGQAVVQDGIAVRPLSMLRKFIPEEQFNQQAQVQYLDMLGQAQRQQALAPDNNPQVIRLRAVARRIIPFATRWNPAAAKWKWQVNLIGSKQVNAFCMPGGRIAFYSGIINSLNMTDDEIAAVMGHEIAHALREHGRERAVTSTGAKLGGRILGAIVAAKTGVDPQLGESLGSAAGDLLSLKFSRDDEREADLIGLDLAARAGFDPRAGVVLWQKMGALSKQKPPELLSTHPGGPERIDQINAHMNVLLPLYAQTRGVSVARLPPYRSGAPVK